MPRFFNTTGPCDPARHCMLQKLWAEDVTVQGKRVRVRGA
jgi:hypothetical protein